MSEQPVSVAVVGHTNTGKTSLMRTLLRDSQFGDVAMKPGTTRHVEGGYLLAGKDIVVELYDTPGLEDSIGLLEAVEAHTQTLGREGLQKFIDELGEQSEFDQEAKVIRQLLGDDLIFYLIDCREPVLGKYRDELKIITMAARPVIPVLNFVAGAHNNLDLWRKSLASLGLHATVNFDTVVFNFADEKRLYLKMQALMTTHHEQIERLIVRRQMEWESQVDAAKKSIATLLIDVAAYRRSVAIKDDQAAPSKHATHVTGDFTEKTTPRFFPGARSTLQQTIRITEQDNINRLLGIFSFDLDDLKNDQIPIQGEKWELDLFDKANLKEFGLDAGSNAAKGAAVGVGVDAMAGGLTLGAAAILGAAAGLIWTAGRKYKAEIGNRLSGQHFICVDDLTLRVVWCRQYKLLRALMHRGHAAQEDIVVLNQNEDIMPREWGRWIRLLRRHPDWSSLNSGNLNLYHSDRIALEVEIVNSLKV